MIVVFIVFLLFVVGVVGVGDIKKVGKIGGKIIFYFEVVIIFVIIIGLFVVNLVYLGNGVNISEFLIISIDKYMSIVEVVFNYGFMDIIINIVLINIFDLFVKGDLFFIIFFLVMFGLGVVVIGEKGKFVFNIC